MTSYFVHFDQPFRDIPFTEGGRQGYLIEDHQLQALTMSGLNYEHRATQTEGLLEVFSANRLQKRLRPFDPDNPVRPAELIVGPRYQYALGPDALFKDEEGAWMVRFEQEVSPLDECTLWTTERRTKSNTVRVREWSKETELSPDIYQMIVERTVAPKTTEGIVILGCAGKLSFPNPAEKFTIHLYSVPEIDAPPTFEVETLFGIKATGLEIFEYEPEERVLVRSPEGVIVGFLFNSHNLYIHVNVLKTGSQREIEILEKILEEAMKMRLQWAEQILIRSFQDRTSRIHNEAQRLEQQIQHRIEQLDSFYKTLNDQRLLLEHYDSFSAEKTIEFLRNHRMIESFDSPSGQSLVIRTAELHVEHPGSGNIHNLGHFRIKLRMDPLQVKIMGETAIMIANQKWYAPHLMALEDGYIQLHNTTPELDRAIAEVSAEHDIPSLLDLVIQCLEDVEEYHHNLTFWPVVS